MQYIDMKTVTVKPNESGQRLDKLLSKILKNAGTSFIYKMLRKKNITLNGKKCEGNEKVNENDQITFFFSDETFLKFTTGEDTGKTEASRPEGIAKTLTPQEIVYEDEDIIVVNKPQGELSQKAVESDLSVNERILSYLNAKGIGVNEAFKPGVCNRLDRNTSGLIVAGKSLRGTQEFARILRSHDLRKFYLTVVRGRLDKKLRSVVYLSKDEQANKVDISQTPKEGYDKIETEIFPLIAGDKYSLAAIRLITGKTHQIRAHLAHLGHCVVGDTKYGGKHLPDEPSHQLLHAFLLCFPNDCSLKGIAGKSISVLPPKSFMSFASKVFNEETIKNAIMEFERTERFQP